jgi:hypothetical protein
VADAVTCGRTRVTPVRGRPGRRIFDADQGHTAAPKTGGAARPSALSRKGRGGRWFIKFSPATPMAADGPLPFVGAAFRLQALVFGGLEEAMASMKPLVCRVLEARNECVTELIALRGLAKAETDKALFLLASKKLRDCSNCPKRAR